MAEEELPDLSGLTFWATRGRYPGSPRAATEDDAAKIVSADRDFDELAVEDIERLVPTDIEVWRQEVERGHAS